MAIWLWIALFSFLASVGVVLSMAIVYFGTISPRIPIPYLLSFAVGTLLSSAFLGLIPEALQSGNHVTILATVLAGMLLFFALEKSLIWRHCHSESCTIHGAPGPLILIGDAFHNFVDGVVIATAFLTSVPTGVGVSIAVIAHEIPQELGDFAVLSNSGYKRRTAFLLNCASSSTSLLGSLAAYLLFSNLQGTVPYVLAISAASFLYIGTADLIPSLQRDFRPASGVAQVASMLSGVIVITLLRAGVFQ